MLIHNRLGMLEGVESMLAHEQRMSQIANNLANVDTNGFRKENVTFWEMLYAVDSSRQRVGKALKVITDHAQGVIKMTGNPLDVAITGKGFFKVQTPDGVRYTRDGNFYRNSEGQMATSNGHLVLGTDGPLVINGTNVFIDRNGAMTVDGETVGRLAVVTLSDFDAVEKEGANLYRLKQGEGAEVAAPDNDYELQQGFIEGSNVKTVLEMTEMLDLQRAFEAQQRAIRTLDDIDGQAAGKVGKLTP